MPCGSNRKSRTCAVVSAVTLDLNRSSGISRALLMDKQNQNAPLSADELGEVGVVPQPVGVPQQQRSMLEEKVNMNACSFD